MQTASPTWLDQPAHNCVLGSHPIAGQALSREELGAQIRASVWTLLSAMYPKAPPLERRRHHRYPYPHLIRLTLLDSHLAPAGGAAVVAGKNLSEQGISFFHVAPIACRKVIVSLEAGEGRWISFLTDLTWCRFTRHGWYESGGCFIRPVETPAPLPQ